MITAQQAKEIDAGWSPFLDHQWAHFSALPPWFVTNLTREIERARCGFLPGPLLTAILGWWGSAKTSSAARRFVRVLLANPWTPAYGIGRPQAVVMAPTRRILTKATIPALEKLFPPEMIIDRRKSPDHWWLLANGCEISFVSGEQGFEGETLCAFWLDEISQYGFDYDPDRFKNYFARLRDPLSPWLEMVVSGLAEAGWVRETFDTQTMDPEQRKNRWTRLCGTNDNPHLPKDLLRQILATTPSDEAEIVTKGGWAVISGGVFANFHPATHLTDLDGDPHAPTHLGLDAGNQGGVVFGQKIRVQTKDVIGTKTTEEGLLIVDQMLTSMESVEDVCKRIKIEKPWVIERGVSTISVDPTLRADELKPLRLHFPGVQIIQRRREEPAYEIAYGIRLCRANLKDGLGNVRIYFNRDLARTRSGIIEAIQVAKKDPVTGVVNKDERTDHIRDAWRYLVCSMFKPRGAFGSI